MVFGEVGKVAVAKTGKTQSLKLLFQNLKKGLKNKFKSADEFKKAYSEPKVAATLEKEYSGVTSLVLYKKKSAFADAWDKTKAWLTNPSNILGMGAFSLVDYIYDSWNDDDDEPQDKPVSGLLGKAAFEAIATLNASRVNNMSFRTVAPEATSVTTSNKPDTPILTGGDPESPSASYGDFLRGILAGSDSTFSKAYSNTGGDTGSPQSGLPFLDWERKSDGMAFGHNLSSFAEEVNFISELDRQVVRPAMRVLGVSRIEELLILRQFIELDIDALLACQKYYKNRR